MICLFQIAEAVFSPHVIPTFGSSIFFFFSFYFSHTEIEKLRVDIQSISWNEIQTQVLHALNLSFLTLNDLTFFGAQL